MFANLKGAVDQYKYKPSTQRLLPLFEAIANSLQSIHLSKIEHGEITIDIERDIRQSPMAAVENTVAPIENIKITDNGEGFGDENYEAFRSLYTPIKKERFGCKGVGRLIWFKTFDKIDVNSVFREASALKKRQFYQTINDELPVGGTAESMVRGKVETSISLISAKADYQRFLKLKLETIKAEIIQHFFPHLVLFANCPKITIRDGSSIETIEKKDLPQSEETNFKIGNEEFTIRHIKNSRSEDKKHKVYYCADSRVVNAEMLSDFTKKKIDDEDSGFFYEGYVSSRFLDERGDKERGSFSIDYSKADDRVDRELGWPDIQKACCDQAKSYLVSYIQKLDKEKEDRIEHILKDEMPYLSYLREENADEISHISVDATEDKIREELTLLHAKNKATTAHEFHKLLSNIETQNGLQDFAQFNEQYKESIAKLNDINKADLASYVLYRQKVLDVFDKLISKIDDKNFEYECGIHSLIFPRFTESDKPEEAYSNHNLWVVDDRWSFFDYAASDKALKDHKTVLDTAATGEPDIALYNVGFAEDLENAIHNSVVLLEFKRPGKESFGKNNPLDQILDYIRDIRAGKIRDYKGQQFSVSETTSFYAYIVCDVKESYKTLLLEEKEFRVTPDRLGYFRTYPAYNAYIEFLPFKKILADAKKRNSVFFKKLGLS